MPRELLADYPQANGRHDELFAAPLEARAHWKPMLDQLAAEPAERMRERLQSVQRQMRENGVTYNMYADPQGADRPWELDVLPLILPQEEWSAIEAAVVQRATLLNATLLDIYGEQRLLREGLLPPALVHGHAGFLRPCHGIKPPGGTMLHLYAADLARSPDGRWWVIDDRTQAPSGAGYALENRIVISRAFPELYRDLKVQHLASFFATLRYSLAHWAPQDGGAPFIVLLTPGPLNETYFEHTYLARYLGLPLVEGSDLTVREGCVWLKTLTGLKRVHALLRRLDDDYCDPLELRSDSALGVPGLVDAMRRGNVLVANALGANLLESSTLLGFLPRLCERLLGEALRMPSVATWWCGEPAALQSVIANLERLVVKAAFPQLRVEPMFGEDLDQRGSKRVIAMLRARPNDYVAQEIVQLSQAPVWDRSHHRRLLARAIGLRVYACASPNGYVVMPGGLTRVASAADARVISMQRGGSSKDTWVIASGPVSTFSLLRRAVGPGELVRSGTNLSSRVVENLFWFGRYSERCDATARLLRLALGRLLDDIPGGEERERPMILELLRGAGILPKGERDPDDAELARTLRAAVADETRPGLAGGLRELARVASPLRERLSFDNWRTLNRMTRGLALHRSRSLALADVLAELDNTIASFTTLSGYALDGMTRDPGWRFLSIGRRIERLQTLCTTLQQALSGPADAELSWLLRLADSIITYRARYMASPEWLPVLDLLVCDEANPRSIAFQVLGLQDFTGRLIELFGDFGAERFESSVAALQGIDPAVDLHPGRGRLSAMLQDWHDASSRLAEQVGLRFFSHVGERSRQTFAS
ncbi:MAG: molybdopterin oxidoreductase [Betaproteobacteria bacterium RIFCSPLOWO2_12_FULL_67_28]|nr:MAG: molybdopterin oxidoreductase [Betaproteobacteria bacterium RIFCSPLOWO2_12_FULL_67_28]